MAADAAAVVAAKTTAHAESPIARVNVMQMPPNIRQVDQCDGIRA
jgi:hypothetical protein